MTYINLLIIILPVGILKSNYLRYKIIKKLKEERMLKTCICIAFSILLISAVKADDCSISESLKDKICSSEFYTAKSQKELDEYLTYGKYKNEKLLNLQINFSINSKEIDIATPCEVKISKAKHLKSTQNGICIKCKSCDLI